MNEAQKAAILERAKRERAKRQSEPASEPNPDGTYGKPPEGMVFNPNTGQMTSKDLLKGAIDPGTQGGALMRGLAQGATFGFADEIGAFGTGDEADQDFQRELDRARLERDRKDAPIASYGGEIAGAVTAPAAALKGGGSLLTRSLAAGGAGAVEGAVYGFGAGEGGFENRAKQARDTAAVSGGIGLLAPGIAHGGSSLVNALMKRKADSKMVKNAPLMEALRNRASTAFDNADKVSGLDRSILTEAAPGIMARAQRAGMDEVLTPNAARAANRIEDAATNPDPAIAFRDLDVLRRQAQVPAGNRGNATEAAIGSGMIDSLDDVVSQASPGLGDEVSEARKLWGQMRRSEMMEEAFKKAERASSGFENGLRVQFRQILNNPQKLRGFSSSEIEAMEAVVQGTKSSNILKKIGKLGVGSGQQSNGLMALLGFGQLGIGAPIAGTIAQKLGERATTKNAEIAKALVASGGQVSAPKVSSEAAARIADLLRRSGRAASPHIQ